MSSEFQNESPEEMWSVVDLINVGIFKRNAISIEHNFFYWLKANTFVFNMKSKGQITSSTCLWSLLSNIRGGGVSSCGPWPSVLSKLAFQLFSRIYSASVFAEFGLQYLLEQARIRKTITKCESPRHLGNEGMGLVKT